MKRERSEKNYDDPKKRHKSESESEDSDIDFDFDSFASTLDFIGGKYINFVDLSEYIMDKKLDHVVQTTWLQKGDCNIFLIGEEHKVHDNKECKGIIDMFYNLKEHLKIDYKIDLMIEITHEDIYGGNYYESESYESIKKQNILQLEGVRMYLLNCIKNKDSCDPLRVHWIDPISTNNDEWLIELSDLLMKDNYQSLLQPTWETNDWIKSKFNPRKDIDNIIKLLTENTVFMTEIKKIKKNEENIDEIFSSFEIEKISSIFKNMFKIRQEIYGFKMAVFQMYRTVLDFYTISRIIQKNMKNVIVYAGGAHIENIKLILCSHFEFNNLKTIEGECYIDGSKHEKKIIKQQKEFIDAYNKMLIINERILKNPL